MSTHPNTILMCILTPDNLSRKTMKQILEYCEVKDDDNNKISEKDYYYKIMEDDYDEGGYQVSAKEGDLVFLDMVTYGYGENITWNDLEKQKNELEIWAKNICARFNCNYEIVITANYW